MRVPGGQVEAAVPVNTVARRRGLSFFFSQFSQKTKELYFGLHATFNVVGKSK